METLMKQLRDNILKGMVLNAISSGHPTLSEIRNHIATTPYEFHYGELYTYQNNYDGLKSALNYYRHQKFISIVGNEKNRPRKYELTSLGYLHSSDPLVRRNYRRARTEKEANKIAESILMDDVRFIEAVKNYVENNVQEADIGDKKTNQVEHSNEDVRIVEKPVLIPENNIVEDDLWDNKTEQLEHSNGEIKATEDLKAVVEAQATRIIEYESAIRYYQSQEAANNTVSIRQLNRELTTAERIQKRQALVYEYINNNYAIDAQFFKLFGNMVPVVIKKVWDWYHPFVQGSVEIMSRGNNEFKRGHAVEMDEELIISSQFYFYQEVENGIEIYGNGMNGPQLVKW